MTAKSDLWVRESVPASGACCGSLKQILHILCGPSLFIVYPVGLFCASFFHCALWSQCGTDLFSRCWNTEGEGTLTLDWHTDYFSTRRFHTSSTNSSLLARPIRCQNVVQAPLPPKQNRISFGANFIHWKLLLIRDFHLCLLLFSNIAL